MENPHLNLALKLLILIFIDLNNKNISLKDFRGKVLLLNFFSSWCESCQEELESLNNLSKDLSNTNFLVIGIAINDQSEELKKLVNEYQIKFPILFDKKNDLQSIYSIKGVPESYFVDGNGKILMFEDPSDGPLIKIVGSRQWNSKSIKEKILSLNGIKVS